MSRNEKASISVRIFDSTFQDILKWKGNNTVGVFIESAVEYYIKSLDCGDALSQIKKSLDEINETQATLLGLSCEVLRQAGILNGNGEVQFIKPAEKPQ